MEPDNFEDPEQESRKVTSEQFESIQTLAIACLECPELPLETYLDQLQGMPGFESGVLPVAAVELFIDMVGGHLNSEIEVSYSVPYLLQSSYPSSEDVKWN